MKKISIITVCLNSVNTIEQTIKSVISQKTSEVEYIIVDGGSVDGTVDIINMYRDYLSYYVSERDDGIYDAMNKGIRHASGDIIGMINSDDWYEPGAFDEVIRLMSDNDACIVSGGIRTWDEQDEVVSEKIFPSMDPIEGMAWGHPAIFARRILYDVYGLFDTSYRIAADYKWLLTCYLLGSRFIYTDRILANFRTTGISNKDYLLLVKENFRLKKEVLTEHRSILNIEVEEIIQKEAAKLEYEFARASLRSERGKELLLHVLHDLEVSREVCLLGYGMWGRKIYDLLKTTDISVKRIYDNNLEVQNVEDNQTTGRIEPLNTALPPENTLIICVEKQNEGIRDQLNGLGIHNYVFIREIINKVGELLTDEQERFVNNDMLV